MKAGGGTALEVLEADLTWTGERFETGFQLEIDPGGRIRRAGSLGLRPARRLAGQALLPGFVNAHSHAFQRGLRGRGEHFPAGQGSFWTWRNAMYELVESLTRDAFLELTTRAYREMRAAGITTVGEFHYLHHGRDAADGQRSFRFDELVLAAARRAGVRLVLLGVYYRTGGIGRPLSGGQIRFDCVGPETYWRQMDRLAERLDPATQSLGAAVHSLRAASPDELEVIHREASTRNLVLHIHVEEQRREIDECLAAYGARPMELLDARLSSAENVTAVHCTHTAHADLEGFLRGGGSVCLCPLTEANLGDGIVDVSSLSQHLGALCLGTDSNARISMLEEMRWLEYAQRLASERRGVLRRDDGDVASILLNAATRGGARALGVPAGRFEPGCWADCVAFDLGHPALEGSDDESLLAALIFGAPDDALAATAVGGRWQPRLAPAG